MLEVRFTKYKVIRSVCAHIIMLIQALYYNIKTCSCFFRNIVTFWLQLKCIKLPACFTKISERESKCLKNNYHVAKIFI